MMRCFVWIQAGSQERPAGETAVNCTRALPRRRWTMVALQPTPPCSLQSYSGQRWAGTMTLVPTPLLAAAAVAVADCTASTLTALARVRQSGAVWRCCDGAGAATAG